MTTERRLLLAAIKVVSRRSSWVWCLYLLAGVLATGGYFLLPSPSAQNVFIVLIDLSGVAAILSGIHIYKPSYPLPWHLLASGTVLSGAADGLWAINSLDSEVPYSSIAELLYVCSVPCFVAGLLLIGQGGTGRNGANLIDSLILATGMGMLLRVFLLDPEGHVATLSLLERVLALTYLLVYVLVLAIVIRPLFVPAKRSPALYLLCGSLAVLVIADLAFGSITSGTYEAYGAGSLVYAGYLLSSALFGAAALHPSMARLSEPVAEAPAILTLGRLVVLTGAMLTPPLVLVIQAALGQPIATVFIVGSSVVLFLLVAARLAGMMSERKALERHLEFQALHDPLTHLPNRLLFTDRLEHALAKAKRSESRVALLFLDLDNFKAINDSLGHEAGDRLLVSVAERMRASLRTGDTAARFGGDEFAILLEDLEDASYATWVAERIIEELEAPFVLGGKEMFVNTSIGIALSAPSTHGEAEMLMRDADTAMYAAKRNGGACYEVFDPSMRYQALERLNLENELRQAIERREFRLHYQPTVSLKTGRIVGFEALVHWEHPERGLVFPCEFVPLAEERSLIVPLGKWVLEEACRQAKQWHEDRRTSDPPLVMTVNLSAKQFERPRLVQYIEHILEDTRLDPLCLNLEITESALMGDGPSTINILRELKASGVSLSIDDFGTGYSSLSYLQRFPADYLKIDRSFVSQLDKGAANKTLVSGMISLAHNLGMKPVGEGVETAEQLACLREMKCELAQGYYFSEPLPSQAASALLSTNVSVTL
jgi:diguanylate cyclase (GGDEF)-like protein